MGNCCLNILITFGDQQYNYSFVREYFSDGSFHRYYATLDEPNDEEGLYLYYNEGISAWQMLSEFDGSLLFTSGETVPLDCPASNSDQWIPEDRVVLDFIIYEIDCEIVTPPSPPVFEDGEPVIYCRNKNLFKKQKAKLSKDIAAISKREVFGFDCGGEWENLFMRSLIIDALSCPPYGVISDDTERCLIGKLNEKCNC
jgi:hypothetical protein